MTARLPSVKYGSPVKFRRGEMLSHGRDAINVAGRLDSPRMSQILNNVVAGLVDVWIDAVSRQVPRLGGESGRRYRD